MSGDSVAPVRVILASSSPQRSEILSRLGIEFEVRRPEVAEVSGGEPAEDVLRNARLKADAVVAALTAEGAEADRTTLVIGCDTDVVFEGRILGKPEDPDQAVDFIERLSGRVHEVISAIVVVRDGERREGVERSRVGFRRLGRDEIDRYVAGGEWRGRAGGYAIQGWGSSLVESVEGDILNVIGLPVRVLQRLAPELGPVSR